MPRKHATSSSKTTRVYTSVFVVHVCVHMHTGKTVMTFEQFLYLSAAFSKMLESECQCFRNTDGFGPLIKPKTVLPLCPSSPQWAPRR